MIIREKILETILAAKISSNPDLAKEFGLEMVSEQIGPEQTKLENRINNQSTISSTEAYK